MTDHDALRYRVLALVRIPQVYFLANDRVFDLAIAFLNSFRVHNPDAPLCLVPFDSRCEKLASLEREYAFSLFSRTDVLEECDRIGSAFHGRPSGHYRKLAIWEGNSDEFIYIDVDTVVLQDVSFAAEFLGQYDVITSHSNMAEIQRWVWKPSIYGAGVLSRDQIEYAANTGFIASRKGALSLAFANSILGAALALAPHMELLCAEQPFLNYLIVKSGRSYTSLFKIALETARCDLPMEHWAGHKDELVRNGKIVFPAYPRTLMMHWAGEWQYDRQIENPLWNYYRHLRDQPKPVPQHATLPYR